MGCGNMLPRTAAVNVSDYRQTMLLELRGRPNNRIYEIRPLFTMNQAPGFTMIDYQRMTIGDDSIVISLPMFATIGRMRIDEVPFERLVIRLKDPLNTDHVK